MPSNELKDMLCILYTEQINHVPPNLVRLEQSPDLVEQVYRALIDSISDGSLAPGQRLTQEDLASQMAVSRQPVLQALRLLKKDGLIQDAPGRGVLVAPLDMGWMRQVYEVRGALDALAVKLAAIQRFRIDPHLIEHGRRAALSDDVKAMIEADLAFHEAIYLASGNPLIAQSAQLHWRHLRRVMGAVLQSTEQRSTVWDEHQGIADAIAAGDCELAVKQINHHSQHASTKLGERLSEQLSTLKTTHGDH